MASTYITKTMTAGNNNTLKFTFSAWVKRTGLSSNDGMHILSVSDEYIYLGFHADSLRFEIHDVDNVRLRSSAKFRDTNAWYHVVFTFDSTQATASDRMKMWVNNEQVTSFDVANYPNQNYGTYIGTNTQHSLGRRENDDSDYFDGIISHAHLTVGYAYTPSAFGETDATTGEWKIKTSPSVTYGNNGFFILKDGNSVTDQSGNGNNFTVGGGTLTNTEDCPSNVFATINPLDNYYGGGTISNGNTKIQTGVAESYTLSTLGASSGKYYCEMKLVSSTSTFKTRFGIAYEPSNATSDWLGKRAVGWSYREDGQVNNNSSSVGGTWSSYTAGDIIGMAFNLDDLQGGLHKLYFSKNGVWQNGADPSNFTSTTGVVGITADKTYLIGIGDETGGYSVCEFNFGNGYFGTTAVSTPGTNASGNGIFEYDVPTGFTALSTKGLNL